MDELNKIAVLYGGTSLERDISLKSGEAVYRSILDLGYASNLIDFKELRSINILKKNDYIKINLISTRLDFDFVDYFCLNLEASYTPKISRLSV